MLGADPLTPSKPDTPSKSSGETPKFGTIPEKNDDESDTVSIGNSDADEDDGDNPENTAPNSDKKKKKKHRTASTDGLLSAKSLSSHAEGWLEDMERS